MANKIKLKRGAEANLPTLDVGEPAFTTDTKKPFIGSDTGNIELATKAQINSLDAQKHESANYALNKNTYNLKPLVTFIDDDGRIETYNIMKPLMESKNVNFVSAVTSNFIGTSGYMTREQILELQTNGHEIASHGVTHSWVDQNLNEIVQSYKELNAMGLNVENLVYPGGNYNINAIKEAKKYYNSAIIVGGGVNISPIRSFAMTRVSMVKTDGSTLHGIVQDASLASYKAMVDYTVANNGWLIVMLHAWYPELNTTQQQNIKDLIDYIKSLNVSIVTLKEGLKTYGNKIDIGDTTEKHFLVGANGLIKSTYLDERLITYKYAHNSNITNTTPISYFQPNNISFASFDVNSVNGFPGGTTAGILETNNMFPPYGHQYWYPYNVFDKIYYRKWNNGTLAWDAFRIIDMVPYYQENLEVSGVTINANSSSVVVLTPLLSANYDVNNNSVIASPRGGLETGVIWTIDLGTDKKFRLKLYNVTGGSITLATRTWYIKIIK